MMITALLLSVIKFTAWLLTSSNAILTDLAESIVHFAAAAMGLSVLKITGKANRKTQLKSQHLSAAVEGALIMTAAVSIAVKAIKDFQKPHIVADEIGTGIILITICGVINFVLGIHLQQRGTKHNSPVLESHGRHLKTDAYSTAALLTGLVALYLFPYDESDNILALIFAVVIGYNGITIIKKGIRGIFSNSN